MGRCKKRLAKDDRRRSRCRAARDLIQRDFAPWTGHRPPLRRRHHLHRDLGGLRLPGDRDRPRQSEVVGWAIANHMRTELVEDALDMAFVNAGPTRGVIFHTDRGSQYTSGDFAQLARTTASCCRSG